MDGDKATATREASTSSAFSKKLWKQDAFHKFYNSVHVQVCVAFLIGANFLTNMVEKQVDPSGTKYTDLFAGLDIFYNIAFTVELAINIYAHWFCNFWHSGWNVFDFVVVSIGVINLLKLPLPPAFNLLRLMRAFRVFRLFKRVKALNKIIVSIVRAVPGVMNAFLILTIVMCIYAILAVELFQDVGIGCKDANYTRSGFKSIRNFCTGTEYFGTFSRSIYTFFQVLTGESWSEAVARPVTWYYVDDPFLAVGSALFFVSFVLVTAFVLINVVVAVLLDKMSDSGEPEEDEEDAAAPPAEEGDAAPAPVPLSKQELRVYRHFHKVTHSLEKLAAKQADMQTDFDRTRADMTEMKQQLSALAEVVERKYGTEKAPVVGKKLSEDFV